MSILSTCQAIQIAIDSVGAREDLPPKTREEAVEILKRISSRDWYVQWDKKTIIAALEEFKRRNGKAPTVSNLTETGMPKSLTIKTHFHMNASLLLKQLFPENRDTKNDINKRMNIYGFKNEEDWLECFRTQFNKNIENGISSKKYDLIRDDGTPTWNTIARRCGCTTWTELMEKAGVKYMRKGSHTARSVHIRRITSPTLERLESINKQKKKLNKELYEILSKKDDLR